MVLQVSVVVLAGGPDTISSSTKQLESDSANGVTTPLSVVAPLSLVISTFVAQVTNEYEVPPRPDDVLPEMVLVAPSEMFRRN